MISDFVIFSDDLYSTGYEDTLFKELHVYFEKKKYQEEFDYSKISNHYKHYTGTEVFFYDQLKFYLIRYAKYVGYEVNSPRNIIEGWLDNVKFELSSLNTCFNSFYSTQKENIDGHFFKYLSKKEDIYNYFYEWELCRIDLNQWMNYKYIEIHKEVNIPKDFSHVYYDGVDELIEELFFEYVEYLTHKIINPRLKNELLAKREKDILNRLFNNTLNKDDKKYLFRTFNLKSKKHISRIITNCLVKNLQIKNYDIHSPSSYHNYFLLIEYYNILNNNKKTEPPKIWIKNLPTKKNETFEALENIYDAIKTWCPKNTWQDFKFVFSENGSDQKIFWTGDQQHLNFLFSKLGNKHIKYHPNKWKAVCYYFKPSNGEEFDPKKIESSNGYKNDSLRLLIEKFKNALT